MSGMRNKFRAALNRTDSLDDPLLISIIKRKPSRTGTAHFSMLNPSIHKFKMLGNRDVVKEEVNESLSNSMESDLLPD